ncbi:MAG TPA: FecR domain-containing protein [Kofleriaceae bacterium]|nr:FecR domain-containing protein [Kofleriaceae bacterium]
MERNVLSRMEGTITSAVGAREIRGQTATRSNWVWLAVPAAAAAAFALAFFSMNGPATTTQAASNEEPSRIVAGDAPSSVTFGDTHLTLDAHTALVMDQDAAKPKAILENGAAQFTIPARGERQLTVLAGDALVRTGNADFRVSRDGEVVKVSVAAGSVHITFRGHDVTVGANQNWP